MIFGCTGSSLAGKKKILKIKLAKKRMSGICRFQAFPLGQVFFYFSISQLLPLSPPIRIIQPISFNLFIALSTVGRNYPVIFPISFIVIDGLIFINEKIQLSFFWQILIFSIIYKRFFINKSFLCKQLFLLPVNLIVSSREISSFCNIQV